MPETAGRWKEIAVSFLKVGATAYGGPAIMGLMQAEFQERRFLGYVRGGWWGGLPVLMLAAYVGYKMLGVTGAVVAAGASFLPSFVLMLGLLPLFERIRDLRWAKAVMQGLIPGVIGVMVVALVRMAPYAAPDLPAVSALVVTAIVLILWRLAPLKVMAGGSLFGLLRTQPWVK